MVVVGQPWRLAKAQRLTKGQATERCFTVSGLLMRMELIKTTKEKKRSAEKNANTLNHGGSLGSFLPVPSNNRLPKEGKRGQLQLVASEMGWGTVSGSG